MSFSLCSQLENEPQLKGPRIVRAQLDQDLHLDQHSGRMGGGPKSSNFHA